MATIYTCDLCGTKHQKDELKHLYEARVDVLVPFESPLSLDSFRADICDQCLSRPISDIFNLFADRYSEDPGERQQ